MKKWKKKIIWKKNESSENETQIIMSVLLKDFQEHDTKTIQYEYVYEKILLEGMDNTKEIVMKELMQKKKKKKKLKSDERSLWEDLILIES